MAVFAKGGAPSEGRPGASWTWLDPAVVVGALGESGRAHPLCADPGGDLAFALAIAGAGAVTHVSPSLAAHALVELKLVAARELPVEGYRCLLGLDPAGRRVFYYHLVRPALSEASRAWWDAREELIRLGLAACGTWERHLEGFRLRVLPMVHRAATLEEALSVHEPEDARRFFEERFDSVAFRAGARAWFAAPVMRALGLPALPEGWLDRLVEGLASCPPSRSWLARFALTGALDDLEGAWPQLTSWGHAALRGAARRLHLVHGEVEEVLGAHPAGTFTAFAPGLLEPEDPRLALALARLLPGGRVVAWIAGEPPEAPPGAARDVQAERDLRRVDRAAAAGRLFVARAGAQAQP